MIIILAFVSPSISIKIYKNVISSFSRPPYGQKTVIFAVFCAIFYVKTVIYGIKKSSIFDVIREKASFFMIKFVVFAVKLFGNSLKFVDFTLKSVDFTVEI